MDDSLRALERAAAKGELPELENLLREAIRAGAQDNYREQWSQYQIAHKWGEPYTVERYRQLPPAQQFLVGNYGTILGTPSEIFTRPQRDKRRFRSIYLDSPYVMKDPTRLRILGEYTNLRALEVHGKHFGDSGAQELAQLHGLHTLCATKNDIGDEGAHQIAKLENLRSLVLDYNKIYDDGAMAIATMTGLQTLSLRGSNIRMPGACELAKLPNLRELRITSVYLTSKDYEELKRMMPYAQVGG